MFQEQLEDICIFSSEETDGHVEYQSSRDHEMASRKSIIDNVLFFIELTLFIH